MHNNSLQFSREQSITNNKQKRKVKKKAEGKEEDDKGTNSSNSNIPPKLPIIMGYNFHLLPIISLNILLDPCRSHALHMQIKNRG